MFAIPPISITYTGMDEAILRARMAEQAWLRAIESVLEWFGKTVTAQMKEGHPPGGPHPPDGELPVFGEHSFIDRTGYLTQSIGYTVESWQQYHASVLIFALASYADLVENGTPRSRPYPFFWPSFYKYLPELEARLAVACNAALTIVSETR